MRISIMGDSISTFSGWVPERNAVYYDKRTATRLGMRGVEDAWWHLLAKRLDAQVLVNESYSGSLVTGLGFPAGSSGMRCSNLSDGASLPDLVIVYMGVNDFWFESRLDAGRTAADIAASPDSSLDPLEFTDAYALMLRRIRAACPRSRIVCGTVAAGSIPTNPSWAFPEKNGRGVTLGAINLAIRNAASACGDDVCEVAARANGYETVDGTHPTRAGHVELARAWARALAG